MKLEAEFISYELDVTDHNLTIQSNGELLPLSYYEGTNTVYSVVDKNGRIVKTVHRWLNYLSKHVGLTVSSTTIELYGKTLSYFCRWIECSQTFKGYSIDESIVLIDHFAVLEWIQSMKERGLQEATLKNREACLKQFFNWLTTIDGGELRSLENSPWGKDNILGNMVKGGHAKSPRYITPEMVISILNCFHNECERCMFHTQYDTGLRISELINFRIKDLPSTDDYDSSLEFIPLHIQGVKGRGGNIKERISLISRAVLNRILRYHNTAAYKLAPNWDINDPNKPVFLTANQFPWYARNASKQFKNAVRRSTVKDEFSSHWLRHGTAFSVLKSNIGRTYEDKMLTVQTMLGHAHLTTTEIYTQISPAILAELTKAGQELDRLTEAETIRSETYLPPLKNKEKRGHRG